MEAKAARVLSPEESESRGELRARSRSIQLPATKSPIPTRNDQCANPADPDCSKDDVGHTAAIGR